MGKKKIVIIGGGVTGLSAGTYALMNGFDVEIYESHNISGGFCTGWKRKDYTIEDCIHWLTGSTEKSPFYKLWKEIGAFEDIEFIDYEIFKKFPKISESIEVTDVVTPYTYFRYTSSYEGNFMTWLMEKDNQNQLNNIPKTINGLNNFYLAGQWVEAVGGLPVAIRSGRDVIQQICHNEERAFVTN